MEKSNVQRDLDKMVNTHTYKHKLSPYKMQHQPVIPGFSSVLLVCLCVLDDPGRAARGADPQPGVGSQAERDLASEAQCSAPQQRQAAVASPPQPGRAQRWVDQPSRSHLVSPSEVLIVLVLLVLYRGENQITIFLHHTASVLLLGCLCVSVFVLLNKNC